MLVHLGEEATMRAAAVAYEYGPSLTSLDAAASRARGIPGEALDRIVTAAVLVATAFRLRDEDGLVLALRRLVAAVEASEREAEHG